MSAKGDKTFGFGRGDYRDSLMVGPNVGGVNIVAKQRLVDSPEWARIVLWFTPRRSRQIAAAMNRAADIAEETKA